MEVQGAKHIHLSFNFAWDDGSESAPEVLLLLNDSEIDRILPENGTQHIEKSVYVSGITPGNYFIKIKQYDFSFNYLIAINYTAALLLTRYGYCSMEVVSRAANWGDDSADILVSGYLFYFGQNDRNFIHVDYRFGNYTVGYYSENATDEGIFPMRTIRIFSIDVPEITIFINKGELSIYAGPFKVYQKPQSNNGNLVLSSFYIIIIILIIISTAILCVFIRRKFRKRPIIIQKMELG